MRSIKRSPPQNALLAVVVAVGSACADCDSAARDRQQSGPFMSIDIRDVQAWESVGTVLGAVGIPIRVYVPRREWNSVYASMLTERIRLFRLGDSALNSEIPFAVDTSDVADGVVRVTLNPELTTNDTWYIYIRYDEEEHRLTPSIRSLGHPFVDSAGLVPFFDREWQYSTVLLDNTGLSFLTHYVVDYRDINQPVLRVRFSRPAIELGDLSATIRACDQDKPPCEAANSEWSETDVEPQIDGHWMTFNLPPNPSNSYTALTLTSAVEVDRWISGAWEHSPLTLSAPLPSPVGALAGFATPPWLE